jgi:adenylate kinase
MGEVVILLGGPGAGKGTQSARLSQELSLPHVSTGDLLREHIAGGTELGRSANGFMEKGQLVPDELVIDMLFERVAQPDCQAGYLLDGFPRTQAQAEALQNRLSPDQNVRAINIEVSDDIIVARVAGRLLCRNCANIHHATNAAPNVAGACDACGGELYRRSDDEPEIIRKRLAVYHEDSAPLVEFYRGRGSLSSVDGEGTPETVFQALRQCIGTEA